MAPNKLEAIFCFDASIPNPNEIAFSLCQKNFDEIFSFFVHWKNDFYECERNRFFMAIQQSSCNFMRFATLIKRIFGIRKKSLIRCAKTTMK